VPQRRDRPHQQTRSPRRRRAIGASSDVDSLERAVTALLRSVGGRSATTLVAERSGSALPAASIVLLEHLAAVGTQRVSQIAECQKVGVPAITPRIQGLQAAGLIRRDADPNDARASLISLTATGRATLTRIRKARCQILAAALHDLDPNSVATAAGVLTRIAAALDKSRLDSRS
jgi:DNA-binding MarR family transcriptional regulator